LKLSYLEIAREWEHYGCTFFKGKNVTQNEQHFFTQDFEGKVRIGVNQNGIHIIEPSKLKIVTYPWDIVIDWHSQKQIFFLEVEDEIKEKSSIKLPTFGRSKRKVPTKQYYFNSKQAELINDLICDWLEEYYKGKELDEFVEEERRKPNDSNKHVSIHINL